jgi:hypothetical protein
MMVLGALAGRIKRMKAKDFYIGLLEAINVPFADMEDARDRRRTLQKTLEREVGDHISGTDTFGTGAIAQATQIRPLHDVDVVVRVPQVPQSWNREPGRAMSDVRSWIEDSIDGTFETTTHAIKISFPDEQFTADVVVGRREEQGITLPHCPTGEPHCWIDSDPQGHRDLVLARNTAFKTQGPSIFSKEIRILKCWNREMELRDAHERKPLSSFHVTALSLHILTKPAEFELWTPAFFDAASRLVLTPLPDPSGVGDDIEARDPAYASALLAEAAHKTAQALKASDDEAEELLLDVFGDPKEREALTGKGPVSVAPTGALVSGAAAGGRSVIKVRSHGDEP